MPWRNVELENRFGGLLTIDDLTGEKLRGLISRREAEDELLDFKQPGAYNRMSGKQADWTREQEFAKDVCSFANHRGGVLVIGIKEVAAQADELSPCLQSDEAADAMEQRLRLAVANNSAPPVDLSFLPVRTGPDEFCMLVVVPPSVSAPHCVTAEHSGRYALRYPVRDGSHTRWMREREVASRYLHRANGASITDQRHKSVVEAGFKSLENSEGLWQYFAVTPAVRQQIPVDTAFLQAADQWLAINLGRGAIYGMSLVGARPIAGPGCATFTPPAHRDEDDDTTPRDCYVALYGDGSVFVAAEHHDEDNVHAIGESSLVDTTIALTQTAVGWASHIHGTWGLALGRAGFVDTSALYPLLRPLGIGAADTGTMQRLRRTRQIAHDPSAELTLDLEAASTLAQRVSIAWQVASSLAHHFGLPEVTQISADGRVRHWEWGSRYQRHVETWATENGLTTTRDMP